MDAILFLHGWGGNGQSFAPAERYFSKYYKTLCPSMPCPPAPVWTLDDYAVYIEGILKDNGIEKCGIICHSFGARVAVLLVKRNPGMVEKLTVCGGAGLKPRFNLILWIKIKIYKIKHRLFGKTSGGSRDYRNLTPNGKRTFNNIIGRDLSGEIKTITVPTLLIYGRLDRATPIYMARRWAKLCKTAELKIYNSAGHFAYLDKTAQFIKDTREFFARNDGGENV